MNGTLINDKMIKKLIGPSYLEDLKISDHHSLYVNDNGFKLLILRGLAMSVYGLGFESIGIVFLPGREVYYYDQEQELFLICDGGQDTWIRSLVDPIYKKNESIVEQYIKEIDKLEDFLYERQAPRIFMDVWFDLKKDLARIERYMSRQITVIQEFHKSTLKIEDFFSQNLKDLLDQLQVSLHFVGGQIVRLDALYHYHNSIKTDKLNRNIYTLTLLSAVFLPLNLIVGFFGMNTEGLFFKDNLNGTHYVLMIILGSLGLSFIGLPVIKFFDHYILKFFLGRYDLYKRFSRKIDSLEKLLKAD